MNAQNFTQKSIEALESARSIALENNSMQICPEHLLYALVDQDGGLIGSLLTKMQVDTDAFLASLDAVISAFPAVTGSGREPDKIYVSPETDRLLNAAAKQAKADKDEYVSVEHLMKAIFDNKTAKIAELFRQYGITRDAFDKCLSAVKSAPVTSDNPEGTYDALAKYGTDLVARAREQKLDPVIGRDDGDPQRHPHPLAQNEEQPRPHRRAGRRQDRHRRRAGAAHRARRRAGGLAEQNRIRARYGRADRGRQVPRRVRGTAQGRAQRGEKEQRRHSCCSSTSCTPSSARARSEGAMDAGNLLKPMLARGELHCIGATTLDEYRKYIEKDAALERRFQPVMVDEPTVEDTISILRGLKERYEVFHGVQIHDAALVAAATLSNRYITDRFLPDKAIDLVDEACAIDPHRNRLDADRAGRPAAQDHAARNRGNGAEKGKRHPLQGAAGKAVRKSLRSMRERFDAHESALGE